MKTWLMVTTEDGFKATVRKGLVGFYGNQAGQNMLCKTAVGDQLIFYIMKKLVLKGLFEITSEPFLDESPLYGDKDKDIMLNQRLKLRPIETEAEAAIRPLTKDLEFTYGSSNYGLYLIKTLRELPPADVKTISTAMKLKALT